MFVCSPQTLCQFPLLCFSTSDDLRNPLRVVELTYDVLLISQFRQTGANGRWDRSRPRLVPPFSRLRAKERPPGVYSAGPRPAGESALTYARSPRRLPSKKAHAKLCWFCTISGMCQDTPVLGAWLGAVPTHKGRLKLSFFLFLFLSAPPATDCCSLRFSRLGTTKLASC